VPVIRPRVPGVAARSGPIGIGIFATRKFAKGRTIGRIGGHVHHWRVLLRRGGTFLANCFRFGDETYLDPGNGLGRYLNHSCAPNAGIRKRDNKLFLFAARDLKPGDEIVIDYSTTIGDDDIYRMRCHCGARRCRKWVGRFGLLPKRLKNDYIKRALFPVFMYDTLEEPPAVANR
jgi:hypothetical protein